MNKTFRLVIVLFVCVAFLFGCEKNTTQEGDKSSDAGNVSGCSIRVENLAGTGLSNVIVSVYTNDTLSDLVRAGKTDSNGVFVISDAVSEGYVAVLSKVPVGYGADAFYPLTGEKTTIALGNGIMTEEDLNSLSYVLGDAMLDFTFVSSDAQEYSLSGLLKDHKAVMLNFWFMGCNPCLSEFPHLQEAYEEYGDEVAVLAMNAIDSSNQEIDDFRKANGYTFPMGKCDMRWCNVMQATAFPLTVIIDRYGNISLMHLGAVPDAQVFMDLFSFYSSDDYSQGFYDTIQKIPGIAGN